MFSLDEVTMFFGDDYQVNEYAKYETSRSVMILTRYYARY
jgi:hypothetical protein